MKLPLPDAGSELSQPASAVEGTVLSTLNALSFLPLVARLTSHPVMISDHAGGTVWINEAFTRLSGWTLEEIAGRPPHEFLHGAGTDPGTVRQNRENVSAALAFQCEILNYRRDGATFWISLDAQPILDDQGSLCGYLSVHSDISVRKQFEQALIREHRLLETVGLCLTTFISSENPKCAFDELLRHLLCLTSSEYGFIGEVLFDDENLPWLKSFTISDVSWDEHSRGLFEQSSESGFEFRNLKSLFGSALLSGKAVISNSPATDPRRCGIPPGHPPLNSFLALPILRGDRMVGLIGLANCPQGYSEDDIQFLQPLGKAIGQLIDAYRRDVQRRKMEQSLRETEEWLEETGRVAEVGAWQLDLASMNLRWSAETYRMHEVPPNFVPDVRRLLCFYGEEAHSSIREAYQKAVTDGTPWDLELPFVTARGSFRWVRAVGRATMENNRVTRIYGTLKDITERRRAEEERERLQAQFIHSQKMESVGRLAGGIAHDFNNMLAVILGHTEMLSLDETLQAGQRSHLKAIQTAGQRSAELTQQLLAFARRQNAAPQKVDINKTVKRVLDLLRRSMGENIELEWMPGDDVWAVSIDPVQLDQILANLCINARDAITDAGRILLSTRNECLPTTRHFRSSQLEAGDYVVLTVSDNGSGMSETTLLHLFEPFNTTKPVSNGPGVGLGLATVYGIVHQNGGAIDVSSNSLIGTTIRIYLPRFGTPESDGPLRVDGTPAQRVKTVMLVEDEPALLKIGRMSLKQLGYKVYTATNAREALQMVQSHGSSIDVVVTDIILPGCNGWDLARQLLEIQPELRFVFMSGHGEYAQISSLPSLEQFPVLSKPFDLQHLGLAVREAAGLTE